MRRTAFQIFIYAAFCMLSLIILSDSLISQDGSVKTELRKVPNNPVTIGEKFFYNIDWGPINVGSATMAIPRVLNYNGHDVYEIRANAASNKFISKIIVVDDHITSYTDTTEFFSWRLEKDLNEGNWHQQGEFLVNHKENLLYTKKDTIQIPEYAQDILSALLYVRTQDLHIGDVIDVPHYDNDKVYFLEVAVLRKQKVRVPAGRFDCIVVEPRLKTHALFKHEGKITVYLSDDNRKAPVLILGKVIFGHIALKLTRIENEILP